MTRVELEKHLGNRVKITVFDGTVIEGFLHKTGEESLKTRQIYTYLVIYIFVLNDNRKKLFLVFLKFRILKN